MLLHLYQIHVLLIGVTQTFSLLLPLSIFQEETVSQSTATDSAHTAKSACLYQVLTFIAYDGSSINHSGYNKSLSSIYWNQHFILLFLYSYIVIPNAGFSWDPCCQLSDLKPNPHNLVHT